MRNCPCVYIYIYMCINGRSTAAPNAGTTNNLIGFCVQWKARPNHNGNRGSQRLTLAPFGVAWRHCSGTRPGNNHTYFVMFGLLVCFCYASPSKLPSPAERTFEHQTVHRVSGRFHCVRERARASVRTLQEYREETVLTH